MFFKKHFFQRIMKEQKGMLLLILLALAPACQGMYTCKTSSHQLVYVIDTGQLYVFTFLRVVMSASGAGTAHPSGAHEFTPGL
jgi:hypothetical protein